MRRAAILIAVTVVVAGVASPALAQDVPAGAFARALAEAAAPAPATTSLVLRQQQGMHPGLLWTGIGLLAGGGLYLALGAAVDPDDRTCVDSTCVSTRKALVGVGAVLAGTGGALLIIGHHKAKSPSPTISFVPRGVMIQKTIPITRAPARRR